MANDKQLRYDGGGTLMFHEPTKGGGRPTRRSVRHGDTFTTDPDTAAILLATDPSVVELDAGGEEIAQAAGTEPATPAKDYDSMSAKQLKAEAKSRKLSQGGKNADIAARLKEDDQAKAAEAAAAAPHPSSSEADPAAPAPPATTEIEADSSGTDATGKTVGGPESAQVGTAGSQGTTSASAPRSGAVNLGDIPSSGKQGPGQS